ncbi:MAG: metal-dependent phosphohydrolase, partial [Acidobacteria bacterium]|nr:metal-dependent phosphohydrolase [Acidobacteriota bacterium]MCU0479569.1 metal-dependent phosphohydrolase [Chloroflexota bacterium]
VMRELARRAGPGAADEELWGICGLLHDADYEAFPDEHPRRTLALLRERGEVELARAIAAHYTKWGEPADTPMARALLACDELTGFVTACSRVHPEGIGGLTAASVLKKFKQKAFAAKVERDEMLAGAASWGEPVEAVAEVVIGVLRAHRDELGL